MREPHEALLVDQKRLARLAARVEGGSCRARRDRQPRQIAVERRGTFAERVAVDGLERGDPFEQQVDARAPNLALLTFDDLPAQTDDVALLVTEPFHLGRELG